MMKFSKIKMVHESCDVDSPFGKISPLDKHPPLNCILHVSRISENGYLKWHAHNSLSVEMYPKKLDFLVKSLQIESGFHLAWFSG
jgi:hypothetical protein